MDKFATCVSYACCFTYEGHMMITWFAILYTLSYGPHIKRQCIWELYVAKLLWLEGP